MERHNHAHLEQEFWDLLVTNRKGREFRLIRCIPEQLRDKSFQLFELLTVDTLQLLDPSMRWTVTGVSRDSGVDFVAEGEIHDFCWLGFTIHPRILGQVKRSKRLTPSLLDRELKKIGKIATAIPVSGMIFVISEPKLDLERVESYFHESDKSIFFRGAKYFVDGRKLVHFWAAHKRRILEILRDCLDSHQTNVVAAYLNDVDPRFPLDIKVALSKPERAQTGRSVKLRLVLSSITPLPKLRLVLKYRKAWSEKNPIEVSRPSKLAHEDGLGLEIQGTERVTIELWLRCYVAGERLLGSIQIMDEEDYLIQEVDLGLVEFDRTFEPRYFAKPNLEIEHIARDCLIEAAAGGVKALIVTGSGGAGKSRFCEIILDQAADKGFHWATIAHPNSSLAERRLLRELILKLVRRTTDAPVGLSETLAELSGIVERSYATMQAALQAYFEENSSEVNPHAVANALLALFALQTERTPLVIHLHDLHWAASETLSILRFMLDNLQANAEIFKNGVFLILEGRDREDLGAALGESRPPADWFDFLQASGIQKVRVPIWSNEDSRLYIEDLILDAVDREEVAVPDRVPLHRELVDYILDHSRGNPMHIVEQLRRMHDQGVISLAPNGLLYVSRQLPRGFATPKTTEGLIQARISFFRRHSPEAIDFFTLMAKISWCVPATLFLHLKRQATEELDRRLLEEMDFGQIPDDAAENFRFYHENYFQVFRSEDLRPSNRFLPAAILWYERLSAASTDEKMALARLLFLTPEPDFPKVLQLLGSILEAARKYQRDQLREEAIRYLLKVPKQIASQLGGFEPDTLRYELATVLTRVGSWEEALAHLHELQRHARSEFGSVSLVSVLKAKAEAANIYVSLQQPDYAICAVDEALPIVGALLGGAADATIPEAGISEESLYLASLREKLWHRRAVAMWFDGRAVEGVRWQRKAFVSARRMNNLRGMSVALREMGTLFYHRNPRLGICLLRKSLDLASKIKDLHHVTIFLTEAQLLLGELLAEWENGIISKVAEIGKRASSLHQQCMETVCIYEACICALVSGTATALLHRLDEAHYWFKVASALAIQARLQDEVWKARLNLAQVCALQGFYTEAQVHCKEAVVVIQKGLDHGAWKARHYRRRLMALPLLHGVRLKGIPLEGIQNYLTPSEIDWLARWHVRPAYKSRLGEHQQILHVRSGEQDYFLMN